MASNIHTKHDRLIETAQDLFMRLGFRRVSIEEICHTAGVSKVTFYKQFKNKMDILTVILNRIADSQMARYHQIMAQEIPYVQKVKAIIRMKQDQAAMFSQELFNDLYKNAQPEIQALLHEMAAKNLSTLRNDFIKARKQGYIRKDVKVDFIMYFMNHMMDMAGDESMIRLYESSEAFISELTRFFFYGILTDRGANHEI